MLMLFQYEDHRLDNIESLSSVIFAVSSGKKNVFSSRIIQISLNKRRTGAAAQVKKYCTCPVLRAAPHVQALFDFRG